MKKKNGIEDSLTELAQSWGDVEEQTGQVDIPDNRYIVRIESATINRAKQSGRLQVSWDLVIADGDFANRHLFSHNGIEDTTGLGFLRGALARLGMDWPDSPSALPEILEQCVGLHAQVNVKTKERNGSEFQNTYFTRVLPDYEPAAGDDEEEAPAKPAAKPKAAQAKAAPAPAPASMPKSKPKAAPVEEVEEVEEVEAPAVGASVEVDYDGETYRGKVKAVNTAKGMATVKFEDGTEDTLSFDSLTIVQSKSKPKAAPVEEVEESEEATADTVEMAFSDDDFNKKQINTLHTLAGQRDLDPDDYESSLDLIVDVAEAAGLTGSFKSIDKALAAISSAE